jgi:DNA-directed RNA polymerase subunit omega
MSAGKVFGTDELERRGRAMARITVEDCLEHMSSRFELVMLAARRAKMLIRGARPVVESTNRAIVTALREVAARKVYFVEPPEGEENVKEIEE